MLDRDLLYQKFIVEDKSVEEVAKYFNTTIGSINYWNKKYNFHKRKEWKNEEIEYLKENFSSEPIGEIARKLNRNVSAVILKSRRLRIGSISANMDNLSAYQLGKALGIQARDVVNFINKYGLKARKVKLIKRRVYRIKLSNFWKWAELNKDKIHWEKVEKNILGKEPPWVDDARKEIDIANKKKYTKWSEYEKDKLRFYYNKGLTYKEIANKLNRGIATVQAMRKKMGLPNKTIELKWQDEEIGILIDMAFKGYKDEEIAEELGRSKKMVVYKKANLREKGILPNFRKIKKLSQPVSKNDNSINSNSL